MYSLIEIVTVNMHVGYIQGILVIFMVIRYFLKNIGTHSISKFSNTFLYYNKNRFEKIGIF